MRQLVLFIYREDRLRRLVNDATISVLYYAYLCMKYTLLLLPLSRFSRVRLCATP